MGGTAGSGGSSGCAAAGSVEAGEPTSCQIPGTGITDCGPNQESCCVSPVVSGGTFYRDYDGVTFTDQSYPATLSDFRLDKYEVTVGRFRKFVDAWVGGWRPQSGAGKHAHLRDGCGLSGEGGTHEEGWQVEWNADAASDKPGWDGKLACDPVLATWTSTAGSNEGSPMNCMSWYEAYAFCIWDRGFLPSEAEWNYAAAGGGEQRVYPWSTPASSTTIDCDRANFSEDWPTSFCYGAPLSVGSLSSGNGKWGHSDLAGNLDEWNLDASNTAQTTWPGYSLIDCEDCTALTPLHIRTRRGGGYPDSAAKVTVSARGFSGNPGSRHPLHGMRCARAP